MMKVSLVKDGPKLMGIELEDDESFYFISLFQDLWPGLRVGKFPSRYDGTDFEREEFCPK